MKSKAAKTVIGLALLCGLHPWSALREQARPKIIAFGSDSPERGTTRVGYWNNERIWARVTCRSTRPPGLAQGVRRQCDL
jgi:hypothetical protein